MILGKSQAFKVSPVSAVDLTWNGWAEDLTSTTTNTFNMTLGTGTIFVCWRADSSTAQPSGITVDGITATVVTDGVTSTSQNQTGSGFSIWKADGVNTPTGDVIVTYGAALAKGTIDVYLNTTGYTIEEVNYVTEVAQTPMNYSIASNSFANGALLITNTSQQDGGSIGDHNTAFDSVTGFTVDTASGDWRIGAGNDTGMSGSVLTTAAEIRAMTIASTAYQSVRSHTAVLSLSPAT